MSTYLRLVIDLPYDDFSPDDYPGCNTPAEAAALDLEQFENGEINVDDLLDIHRPEEWGLHAEVIDQ